PATDPPTFANPLAQPLLFAGSYHVTETAPPPGYLLPDHAADGTDVSVPQAKNADGVVIPQAFHDPLGSLTFFKVDAQSTSTPVGGASFLVHRLVTVGVTQADVPVTDKTTTPIAAGTNDDNAANGTMTVSGLKTGTYAVTETTPLPAGYG